MKVLLLLACLVAAADAGHYPGHSPQPCNDCSCWKGYGGATDAKQHLTNYCQVRTISNAEGKGRGKEERKVETHALGPC